MLPLPGITLQVNATPPPGRISLLTLPAKSERVVNAERRAHGKPRRDLPKAASFVVGARPIPLALENVGRAFTGHVPTQPTGRVHLRGFQTLTGQVGLGQGVLEISRVGSGRDRRFSNITGWPGSPWPHPARRSDLARKNPENRL